MNKKNEYSHTQTAYIQELDEINKKRIKALTNHKAEKYYKLCEDLGLEEDSVEDKLLYSEGKSWVAAKQMQESNLERIASRQKRIVDFLKEGSCVNISDFSSDAIIKRSLLEKYFPGRFGENGKQNLSRYSRSQIGAIFANVTKSYND